jgi:hypothetical protein
MIYEDDISAGFTGRRLTVGGNAGCVVAESIGVVTTRVGLAITGMVIVGIEPGVCVSSGV